MFGSFIMFVWCYILSIYLFITYNTLLRIIRISYLAIEVKLFLQLDLFSSKGMKCSQSIPSTFHIYFYFIVFILSLIYAGVHHTPPPTCSLHLLVYHCINIHDHNHSCIYFYNLEQ